MFFYPRFIVTISQVSIFCIKKQIIVIFDKLYLNFVKIDVEHTCSTTDQLIYTFFCNQFFLLTVKVMTISLTPIYNVLYKIPPPNNFNIFFSS